MEENQVDTITLETVIIKLKDEFNLNERIIEILIHSITGIFSLFDIDDHEINEISLNETEPLISFCLTLLYYCPKGFRFIKDVYKDAFPREKTVQKLYRTISTRPGMKSKFEILERNSVMESDLRRANELAQNSLVSQGAVLNGIVENSNRTGSESPSIQSYISIDGTANLTPSHIHDISNPSSSYEYPLSDSQIPIRSVSRSAYATHRTLHTISQYPELSSSNSMGKELSYPDYQDPMVSYVNNTSSNSISSSVTQNIVSSSHVDCSTLPIKTEISVDSFDNVSPSAIILESPAVCVDICTSRLVVSPSSANVAMSLDEELSPVDDKTVIAEEIASVSSSLANSNSSDGCSSSVIVPLLYPEPINAARNCSNVFAAKDKNLSIPPSIYHASQSDSTDGSSIVFPEVKNESSLEDNSCSTSMEFQQSYCDTSSEKKISILPSADQLSLQSDSKNVDISSMDTSGSPVKCSTIIINEESFTDIPRSIGDSFTQSNVSSISENPDDNINFNDSSPFYDHETCVISSSAISVSSPKTDLERGVTIEFSSSIVNPIEKMEQSEPNLELSDDSNIRMEGENSPYVTRSRTFSKVKSKYSRPLSRHKSARRLMSKDNSITSRTKNMSAEADDCKIKFKEHLSEDEMDTVLDGICNQNSVNRLPFCESPKSKKVGKKAKTDRLSNKSKKLSDIEIRTENFILKKDCIKYKDQLGKCRRKIKTMHDSVRYLEKKSKVQKEIISDIEQKLSLSDTFNGVLEHPSSTPIRKELLKCMLKVKKRVRNTYSATFLNFCLKIQSYSPEAYKYLRQNLDGCFPHLSVLRKWRNNCFKKANAKSMEKARAEVNITN